MPVPSTRHARHRPERGTLPRTTRKGLATLGEAPNRSTALTFCDDSPTSPGLRDDDTTVRPTPGISCERPIFSTLVCFIPLFDAAALLRAESSCCVSQELLTPCSWVGIALVRSDRFLGVACRSRSLTLRRLDEPVQHENGAHEEHSRNADVRVERIATSPCAHDRCDGDCCEEDCPHGQRMTPAAKRQRATHHLSYRTNTPGCWPLDSSGVLPLAGMFTSSPLLGGEHLVCGPDNRIKERERASRGPWSG